MVGISSAGLLRAKTLLGLEENSDLKHFEGFEQEGEHLTSAEPCILQSSSHLDVNQAATNLLSTGDASKSFFQTGSGKIVSISSAGLVRAKTLLGLEENSDLKQLEGFDWEGGRPKQCSSSLNVNMVASNTLPTVDAIIPISRSDIKFNSPFCETNKEFPDFMQSESKPPPIRFHTAGGRSISVSSDALQRARSLLGDHDVGAHDNNENANDNLFSFTGGRECKDISQDKENDSVTPFSHLRIGSGQSMSKNFTSPLQIDSCQKQQNFRLGNVVTGNNLIKKFDAEANESGNNSHNGYSPNGNPLNKKLHLGRLGVLGNSVGSKNNQLQRSSKEPLVDISNNIYENSADAKLSSGEKRRLISTVSPFKRPRISKFVTPLKKNNSAIPPGKSSFVWRKIFIFILVELSYE